MKINIHTHSPKQGELTLSTLGIHPYDAEVATTDAILSIERMAQGVDAIATSRGYYLSFGERTFRSPKSIEAMKATPIDRLFFETDESSVDIEEIYNKAAEVLAVPVKILEYITHENFKRICG